MTNKRQDRKKENLIIQGGVLSITGLAAGWLALGKQIPLTYMIGDKGNGIYAAAFESFFFLWLLTTYSIPAAVSVLISTRIRQGQFKNGRLIFRTALLYTLLAGLAGGLILFLGSDWIAAHVLREPASGIALKVLAPALLLAGVSGVLRGYFQGMGTAMPTAVSSVLEQLVFIAVCLPVASAASKYGEKVGALLQNNDFSSAFGAAGAMSGVLAGSFASILFLLFIYAVSHPIYKRQKDRHGTRYTESWKVSLKALILSAAPAALCVLCYHGYLLTDQLLFRYILQENAMESLQNTQWGIYYGKYKIITGFPILFSLSMGAHLAPGLKALQRRKAYPQIRERISMVMKCTMLVVIPSAVMIGVLAGPLVETLYHAEDATAVSLISSGCISVIFYALAYLMAEALKGIRRMTYVIVSGLFVWIVRTAALYLMMEEMGLEIFAAVYADILAAFLLCMLNGFFIKKYIRLNRGILQTYLPSVLASAVMGVILLLLSKAVQSALGQEVTLAVCIGTGLILYNILLLIFRGVTERELYMLPFGRLICRAAKALRLMQGG